ncbi:MAG: alkaline phosphatase [Paramuribaculum sp.]|nr:alkaline phosphatase [Paramuribaculum sp.]
MTKHYLTAISLLIISAIANAAPRYIFYFIGDGMGLGHIAATDAYLRHTSPGSRLLMTTFPVAGVVTTHSASSRVTDSAAAGTALATGTKTKNYMLGMNPDSISLMSIASRLKNNGYGIGIVTSVAADDATPGAFFAHVPNRGMFYDIGLDMIGSGYEFVAGANLRGTSADGKSTDLPDRFRDAGIDIVRGCDNARKSKSRRVLMLAPDSTRTNNIGYTIDSIKETVSLPEMTATCLDHLKKHTPDSFFIMVEGGNIDHAAHSRDGGAVIKEIINFDKAISIAHEFYLAHPDETLIIVTADHDTSGMTNGDYGKAGSTDISIIDSQRMSKDEFTKWSTAYASGSAVSWEYMKEFLTSEFGLWKKIPVNEKDENNLKEKFDKAFILGNGTTTKSWYNDFNEFSIALFDLLNNKAGIYWTSDTHTGNLVPVYAVGIGKEAFSAFNDNTSIPEKIMNAGNQQQN